VLTRDAPTQWIPLGAAADIEARVRLDQKYMRRRVRETTLSGVLHGLFQTLCEPVLAALPPGTHRLIMCPDGELNFISFATLLDAQGHFFGGDLEIDYVSSGRDLLRSPPLPPRNKRLVVFADPDYDRDPGVAAEPPPKTRAAAKLDDILPPLPGTEREAMALLQEAKDGGLDTLLYRGSEASKANLGKLDSPYILHLATHGLYLSAAAVPNLPQPDATKSPAGEPMMRSLLALAGGAITLRDWEKDVFPPADNDGLLTAQQAATLNLDRTWLVVLSACDTGSGEARAGEGVLGLRRGFAEAGAQNLLMTLWPADDAATAGLMAAFYRETLRTGDAPGSLARVQRATLDDVRAKRGLFEAVHQAGPFILSY
jgi:CHAT domain-containing protein